MKLTKPGSSPSKGVLQVVLAGFALFVQATAGAATYDLGNDFSLLGNPNGPWTYGDLGYGFPPGVFFFNDFTDHGAVTLGNVNYDAWGGLVLHNPQAPGSVFFYSLQDSSKPYLGARFTTPVGASGVYSVVVHASVDGGSSGTYGSSCIFSLRQNTNFIVQTSVYAGESALDYSANLPLNEGDTVDFLGSLGASVGMFVPEGTHVEAVLTRTGPLPPAPDGLGFSLEGNNLVLRWSATNASLLQFSTSLFPAVWQTAGNPPAVVGNYSYATNPVIGPALFYRLNKN